MHREHHPMSGQPVSLSEIKKDMTINFLIENLGSSGIEARNVADGARLYKTMIDSGDCIALGAAGIFAVVGMGGYVLQLMKRGFIDWVCTTGAQAYHDLHHAYGFPVVQGNPHKGDDYLREKGVVRIFDTYISEKKTLLAQDKVIQEFLRQAEFEGTISSADFNCALGEFVRKDAPHPEKSFIAQAAKYNVPVFLDSHSNHSIGINLAHSRLEGKIIDLSADLDVLESAALVHATGSDAFVELGGGGPKNFIQQTGPTITQILGIEFEGADRGLQITTALERDGGLSGCTLNEAVTWKKYKHTGKNLVQIFGEYSVIFPLMCWYVVENCRPRERRGLLLRKKEFYNNLVAAAAEANLVGTLERMDKLEKAGR